MKFNEKMNHIRLFLVKTYNQTAEEFARLRKKSFQKFQFPYHTKPGVFQNLFFFLL